MTECVMIDRELIRKVSASLHDYKDGAEWGAFDLSALMELDDILAAPQQAAEPVAIAKTRREFHDYENSALEDDTGYLVTHVVWVKDPQDIGEIKLYAGRPPAQRDHMAQSEQMENAAYALGVIEMGLAVKQLCSDFSDRANRPYMKDVTDAIASLAGQVANEGREAHSDDLAVDFFAHAMKRKLAQKRGEGRGGWETCPPELLGKMLVDHIAKGDPVDVANFCMMLHQNGARIRMPEQDQKQVDIFGGGV